MANTALITGASSGIGKELARYHASKGGDLVLVARRKEVLQSLEDELQTKHQVSVHVVAMDLTAKGAIEKLEQNIKKAGIEVDILINNAGFGGLGKHVDRSLDDELSMIDLNVKTLVALTHTFANAMASRGHGKVLNVGSTAGFMPGPNQAVYFGTKAFVNSFSQAIDQELRSKGVTCTLLAPGYVETEFADRAEMDGTNLTKGGGDTAENVARLAYDAMDRGQLVVFNETKLKLMINWLIPFLPRRQVLKMVEDMQSKAS